MIASADALRSYLADLVEQIERLAVTVLPPNDADEIEVFERWRPSGHDQFERVDYRFEIRHHELGYRRVFHRHDAERFLRAFDVATHEHCEATLGYATCAHYFGDPVVDASDGFRRVYELWLTDAKPDCSALPCLGWPFHADDHLPRRS